MPELVKIPLAATDYVAHYERPDTGFFFERRQAVFERILDAWLPYNLRLANIEIVAGAVAEQKVIVKLPERRITFQFGGEEYKFIKEGSSWATAKEDGEIFSAAEAALLEQSDVKIKGGQVNVAMHLQPITKTREEILAPFMPEPFKFLVRKREVKSHGNHIRFAGGDVLLDYSAGYANGIFMRYSSETVGHQPIEKILEQVYSYEKELFEILGVEEEAPDANA
jgi:hypothetical protein